MAVLSDVLVVNAGSTSLKLSLVDDDDRSHPSDSLATRPSRRVGHRVVHGGERFCAPTLIDDAVTAELARCSSSRRCTTRRRSRQSPRRARGFRPQPRSPSSTRRSTRRFPRSHARTPSPAASATGASDGSASTGSRSHGPPSRCRSTRLVVCHLGGGASVTAVARRTLDRHDDGLHAARGSADGHARRLGRSRRAPLSPAPRRRRSTSSTTHSSTNRDCLGLAGSDDVAALEGDPCPDAALALEIYCYRIAQAFAAMAAALGGLDALVFTAGVGEHSAQVRAQVCARLRPPRSLARRRRERRAVRRGRDRRACLGRAGSGCARARGRCRGSGSSRPARPDG